MLVSCSTKKLNKKAKYLLCVCLPQAVRLEALHRFTVLWHLTREIQTNRTTSLNHSFDRLVVCSFFY